MILVFCKDGHLRLKYDFDEVKEFPLLSIEAFYKSLDGQLSLLAFWKQYWFLPIEFENGLTFREFFLNLEPWADFFQDIVPQAVDLKAFIKEVKKPGFVKPEDSQFTEIICDMVVINQVTSISPIIFRKNNSKNTYIPITETNGKFMSEYQIQVSGVYKDLRDETFNIENCPLNYLANKPIYLNRNHYFIVDKFNDVVAKSNHIPNSVFNSEAYGAFKFNEFQDIIISEKSLNILDLLTHFFKFFFCSPDERNITMKNIDKFLAEIEYDEACQLFQQEDKIIEARLISESVTEKEHDIYDDINDTREQIYTINAQCPNIENKDINISFQKNAFSHLDYKAHKAKALIDAQLFGDNSGEVKNKKTEASEAGEI